MNMHNSRSLLIGAVCSFFAGMALISPSTADDRAVAAADRTDPLSALPKLDSGNARVLFFRPGRFVGMVVDARIRMDGTTVGWVGSGSAVYVDHAPGDVRIGVGGSNGYGRSDFAITLKPGQEYFVTLASQANFGLFSCEIEAVVQSKVNQQHCGYCWCASVVDKSAALPQFSALSISGPNPRAN
jgi:hypothetical protein